MKNKQLITGVLVSTLLVWIVLALVPDVLMSGKSLMGSLLTDIPLPSLTGRIAVVILVALLLIFFNKRSTEQRMNANSETIEIEIPDGIKKIANADPEFLDNFLHKVKVQLNNIFGFADLLRDEEKDREKIERYFGYIESSKQSVYAAIDELISVLKMGKIKTWKKGDDYLEIINWNGKKILIAEDVETNFILLKAVLEKTGAEVIRAENGMEALKIFRKDRGIDLILMDILMPEMDGFEATKAIRKFHSSVPIIAQTAYNFDWNAIQKEGLGFNDYLAKPIGHYDLILKCYRYLES